jgi:recombination protein RecT
MTAPMTTLNGQIVPASETRRTLEAWFRNAEMQARLKAILPQIITPERFVAVALTSLSRNPQLMVCTPQSLFRCMVQAAMVGLEVDSGLGHAYLVPFKQECTLILGYRGLVQLMHRSATVRSISAQVVRDGDEFSYNFGLEPTLRHVPAVVPADEEFAGQKVTYAYVVITYTDGMKQFDVMHRKEIDKVRARSRAGHSGPWVTDYPEMAKKTVLRRLAKLAPMSVQDQRVVIADELADAGQAQAEAFSDVELPLIKEVPPPAPLPVGEAPKETGWTDADMEPRQTEMPTGAKEVRAADHEVARHLCGRGQDRP